MRTLQSHPRFVTSASLRSSGESVARLVGLTLLVLGLFVSGALLAGIARELLTLAGDVERVLDDGIRSTLPRAIRVGP